MRRLVAAAAELTAEDGPGFTIQRVAARAGVSLKTFYRSFPGKDALLLAVFEEDNRRAADVLERLIARHAEPRARLRAYVHGLFQLSMERGDRLHSGLVLREYLRLAQNHQPEVEHALRPFVDLLAGELQRAADLGAVNLRDARRDAAAIFLLVVSHLCPLILGGDDGDATGAAAFVADFALAAVGAQS
jgi:AcrR family transcriptional regulator